MTAQRQLVAFGISEKRFGKFTAHPNLDRSGLFVSRTIACDPGLYHPKDIRDVYRLKTKGINKEPWRRRKELEEWAKNLGYRNQKILKYRKWVNSVLGPAWHDIRETKQQSVSKVNDLSFGRVSRFVTQRKKIPGPGTYYKTKPYKVPSYSRPTFESGEPCRFKDTSPKWSLACNRYKIVDKESIEEKSNKVTSLRGPYDLFTGVRDNRTIKNHFGNSGIISANTWPYKCKGSFETYKKCKFGELNKTNMETPCRGRLAISDINMCLKKVSDPGPGSYDPYKGRTFKKFKHGFNSSYDKPPGYRKVVVWPGVGRYNVKDPSCGIFGQGHRFVFLSKVERTIGAYIPQPMNSF